MTDCNQARTHATRMRACIKRVLVPLLLSICALSNAQDQDRSMPNFEGTWIWQLTSLEDPRWRPEDLLCYFCAIPVYEYLQGVLADPKSADRPLQEIQDEVEAYNKKFITDLLTTAAQNFKSKYDQAQDPVLKCQPVGFFTQSDAILPLKIEQHENRIVFKYEYWNAERTVYMDGRGHPPNAPPSRLGHSIGWYDGRTLVVETTGIEANIFGAIVVDGMRNSSNARAIERYVRSEDGGRLDREMTIVDPWTLRRPLVVKHSWLIGPNEHLKEFKCDALSGVP